MNRLDNFYKSELDLTGAMNLDRVQVFDDTDVRIEFQNVVTTGDDSIFINSSLQLNPDNYRALKLAIALIDKAINNGDEGIAFNKDGSIYVMRDSGGTSQPVHEYLA